MADRTAEQEAAKRLQDLTRRLGFGDGITEPQADNDTIVAWFKEQSRDAAEWREHELWRDDCYLAGHPQDEDCDDCGPTCCNRRHVSSTLPGGGDSDG
ncbi:hypothetical protein [Microcystis phage MinS1]|nr:hypothetical protein [Microcystis phage MinS1]